MQCPQCQYVLSDFDAECPRCQRLATLNKQNLVTEPSLTTTPLPQPQAPSLSDDQVVQHQQTQILEQQSSLFPAATVSTRCSQCGNSAVRKVSAIVQAETWSSTTERKSVKIGRYGYGVGASTGHTSTVNRRTSHLAEALLPPVQPHFPPKPQIQAPKRETPGQAAFWGALGLGCSGLLLLPFIGFLSLFNSAKASLMFGFFFGGAFLLVVLGLILNHRKAKEVEQRYQLAFSQWQHHQDKALSEWEQECEKLQQRWEEAFSRWDCLFYCSRCDQVYHPQTEQSAPSAFMHQIL